MRLLLVMPGREDDYWGGVASLGLATIAGLTPPDVDVRFADAAFDDLDYDSPVDLVGITVTTRQSPRAFSIATQFRLRGVPVVLGGIHPSALPAEALKFADAVVVGEAEGVWPRVVEDVRRGQLQRIYRAEGWTDLRQARLPRLDIFPAGRYRMTNVIQASRGCPFDCEFCSVTSYFGRTYRHKPVEQVLREIERLPSDGPVLFVDDNIVGNPDYAKSLFKAIAPYRLRWVGQASTTLAQDDELLELARASGCRMMLIGFESTNPHNLDAMGKRANRADQFAQQIAKIQSYDISIFGSFIVGYDHDDGSAFESMIQFAEQTRIEHMQLFISVPFPGTRLRERLEKEGRIFDHDWGHYTGLRAVFKPKLLSPTELEDGREWVVRRFYSLPSVFRRLVLGPRPWRRSRLSMFLVNVSNMLARPENDATGPASALIRSSAAIVHRLANRAARSR